MSFLAKKNFPDFSILRYPSKIFSNYVINLLIHLIFSSNTQRTRQKLITRSIYAIFIRKFKLYSLSLRLFNTIVTILRCVHNDSVVQTICSILKTNFFETVLFFIIIIVFGYTESQKNNHIPLINVLNLIFPILPHYSTLTARTMMLQMKILIYLGLG